MKALSFAALKFKVGKTTGSGPTKVHPTPSPYLLHAHANCPVPPATSCLLPEATTKLPSQTDPISENTGGSSLHDIRGPSSHPVPPVTMFSRQALLRSARTVAPQRAFLGQTRAFAAPAASQRVQAPVALFGLDGTYATALVRALPTTQLALRFAHHVEDLRLEGWWQALNCRSAVDKATRNRHN